MNKIYFFAPNIETHYLFNQDSQKWIGISNNFTFWIVNTYLNLKKLDFPCEIVKDMPKQGIVIADRDTLGNKFPYLGKTMLISAKGDREFHPSAHINVVQNPTDVENLNNSLWNPYYVHPWPQPNLTPRSIERHSLVENIAFLGTKYNLAPELLSENWVDLVRKEGCQWYPIFDKNKWNDYTNLDLILAVRSFDGKSYGHKPASKLINCWRGLVPGILAPESAYLSLKKSELDFLTVNSLDESIEAIRKLKNNPKLYLSMIENGKKRAKEFTEEQITQQWVSFFTKYTMNKYQEWIKMSELEKRYLYSKRYLLLKVKRMKGRLKK